MRAAPCPRWKAAPRTRPGSSGSAATPRWAPGPRSSPGTTGSPGGGSPGSRTRPRAPAGRGGGGRGGGRTRGAPRGRWPATRARGCGGGQTGGRIERICGDGVEALEVPRPAGVVAVHWWLHTGGAPDEIRGLPALPGPQDALAAVAAGDRFLFLVQPGACPWVGPDLSVATP